MCIAPTKWLTWSHRGLASGRTPYLHGGGRYASFLPAEAVARLFHTVNPLPNFPPTWNMAPTQDAMVVRHHPEPVNATSIC